MDRGCSSPGASSNAYHREQAKQHSAQTEARHWAIGDERMSEGIQPKQRKSRQSVATQSAIIAKYAMNEPKCKIAKDLGIAKQTVLTVLNATEIKRTVEEGRSRAISLIPRSLEVAEYRLSKNDGTMALGILRGTKVLVNEQLTQVSGGLFLANIPVEWMQGWEESVKAGKADGNTTTNGIASEPTTDIDLTPLPSTEVG